MEGKGRSSPCTRRLPCSLWCQWGGHLEGQGWEMMWRCHQNWFQNFCMKLIRLTLLMRRPHITCWPAWTWADGCVWCLFCEILRCFGVRFHFVEWQGNGRLVVCRAQRLNIDKAMSISTLWFGRTSLIKTCHSENSMIISFMIGFMALYNQMISSILCLNCWISEVRLSFQFAQMWWRIGSIISSELAPNGFGPGSNSTFRSSESTTLWSSSWVQGRRMMQTSVTVWEDVCIVYSYHTVCLDAFLVGSFFLLGQWV